MDPKNNSVGFGCYPTVPSASSDKLGCVEISEDWDFRVGGESILDLIASATVTDLPTIIISDTQPDAPTDGTTLIWLDIS